MSNKKSQYKIIILGESGIGKTSFITRIIGNDFQEEQISTIGIDFFMLNKIDNNGNKIALKLYDTSGQEAYKSMAINILRTIDAVIFMYDITNQKTFNNLEEKWFKVNDIVDLKSIVLCLVGNKNELIDNREVSYEEGENLAKKYNMAFFEVSVKNNSNIEEVISSVANNIVDKFGYKGEENEKGKEKKFSIKLSDNDKPNKKKRKLLC
jgi:small GTP-binding protein